MVQRAFYKNTLKNIAQTVLAVALLSPVSALAISPGKSLDAGPCVGNCQLGPDPTTEFLEATRGPFDVENINIPGSVKGFNGGRIFYPPEVNKKMGLVVMGPGFLFLDEWSSRWWGPRLASHGFVVVSINFNTVLDLPDQRAAQYSKALDYVIALSKDSNSPIYNKVDENRLGSGGWSMGGGGALQLGLRRPLKAIFPWAPWYTFQGVFSKLTAPTMIIACEFDIIAPNALHSTPIWEVIPRTTPKQFVLFNTAENHWCGNGGKSLGNMNKTVIGKLGVAWFKRHMDDDMRYEKFLCGADLSQEKGVISERNNCDKL